ncbi:MAG: MBL fold metallo-hydrolase [Sulfolobales archaeon]|nr:MBL fold metallo-hydrolase [Sulfolobales archaeon]MCG2911330.1 MBL fold metallo-hydrolase [Sulfolobales archaeon]
MEITPLGFESLGARSQATLVETKDVRVLIDPAVSLAPRRFGLPPHQLEVDALTEIAKRITEVAKDVDVIVVTHYHYDHHDPGWVVPKEIYRDKVVIIKDPANMINPSQKFRRAPRFLKAIQGLPKRIEIGDGRSFAFGSTEIIISNAVPHGNDERLGYVIQVAVKDKDGSVLFTSDIEGAPKEEHVKFTEEVEPNALIVDGPLSYLLGRALSEEDLDRGIKNLERLIKRGLQWAVIDHHVLRDPNYESVLKPVIEYARSVGVKVLKASDLLGVEPKLLEMHRRELFERDYRPAKVPRGLAQLLNAGES